jgi:hypothetical protein
MNSKILLNLLIPLMACSTIVAHAQQDSIELDSAHKKLSSSGAQVTWGTPVHDSREYQLVKLLGVDTWSGNSLWLARENGIVLLEKFDANNNRILSKEIDQLDISKIKSSQRVQIEDIIMLQDNLTVLSRYVESKAGTLTVFLFQLSFDGTVISTPVKICESSNLDSFAHLAVSPDSSRVLVGVGIPIKKQIKKNQFLVRVFDTQLRAIYTKDIFLAAGTTDDSTRIHILQMAINNSHQIYFTTRKSGSKIRKEPTLFWSVDMNRDEVNEAQPEIGHDIDELYVVNTKRGETILCGFYFQEGDKESNGVFYGTINTKTKKVGQFRFTGIPPLTVRRSARSELSVQFVAKMDGSLVMLAEEFSVERSKLQFGNIVIVNYQDGGLVKYCSVVPKAQGFYPLAYPGQYSYFPMYDEETKRLHIIFNEHERNLLKTGVHFSMVLPNRAVPILITLTDEGKTTTSRLFKETYGIALFPLLSAQVSNHKAFIIGRKRKEFGLGSLILE